MHLENTHSNFKTLNTKSKYTKRYKISDFYALHKWWIDVWTSAHVKTDMARFSLTHDRPSHQISCMLTNPISQNSHTHVHTAAATTWPTSSFCSVTLVKVIQVQRT